MGGIGVAGALLHFGRLRPSFADYETYLKAGETLADYPHARREMGIELLFLLPCGIGLAGGWLLGGMLPAAPPPLVVQAIGGTFAGYLVGGGLVWVVRILATFVFGREAMGLGDVHLLAAVGAVLGCEAPIWVFFLAPFSGLLWFALSKGLMAVFKKAQRELPYGPHLAVATLVALVCRAAINWFKAAFWVP
jgi:leader peptidase (prepilin peptidase)/N-methyltransferase